MVINYFINGSGETVVLLPAFARAASDYNELVASLLDDLPGGKVHVLGRAFGARVGRAFAADYPHLVQSMIMMAGGGR